MRRSTEKEEGSRAYCRTRRRLWWRDHGAAPRAASAWSARRRDYARQPREFLRPHAAPVRILLGEAGTAALRSADPRHPAADALHLGERRPRRRRTPGGASRFAAGKWLRPA